MLFRTESISWIFGFAKTSERTDLMFEKVEVSPLSFLQETTENNKDIMIMPIILIVKRLLFIFDKFGMCIVIEKIQFF